MLRRFSLGLSIIALVSQMVPATASPQLMWQDYEQPGFLATRKKIYQAAELALTNHLETVNATTNPNQRVILSFVERLIVVCAAQSKYADVENYCTIALRFCEKGNEPPLRKALLYSALGRAYLKQGKLTQADLQFERALALLSDTMPATEQAKVYSGYAEVLTHERKLDKAHELFEKTLSLEKENGGTESPANLVRYAKCLLAESKLDNSADALRRAVAIDKEQLGEGHPALAADLNNLAIIECKQEQMPKAETSMKEALNIARQFKYADLPDWLDTMSAILSRANKSKESHVLADEAQLMRNGVKKTAAKSSGLQ